MYVFQHISMEYWAWMLWGLLAGTVRIERRRFCNQRVQVLGKGEEVAGSYVTEPVLNEESVNLPEVQTADNSQRDGGNYQTCFSWTPFPSPGVYVCVCACVCGACLRIHTHRIARCWVLYLSVLLLNYLYRPSPDNKLKRLKKLKKTKCYFILNVWRPILVLWPVPITPPPRHTHTHTPHSAKGPESTQPSRMSLDHKDVTVNDEGGCIFLVVYILP